MPRKTAKTARKPPLQARSVATVTAILDATVRVLEKEGPDAATTTRIAAVAGVSVGTLYQYFSHLDAIVDALLDREFDRAIAMMSEVLSEGNLARSPRESVTAVMRGLMSIYLAHPGLHRVLAMEALRIAEADRVRAFDLRVIAIASHFLAATGTAVRRLDVNSAAFVVFQSVRATMLAYLLERPPGISEAALIDELVDMLLRYLIDDAWLAKTPPVTQLPFLPSKKRVRS
ncbi:MAG: TetR/AcrR family transcriptional regulator [Polyangiaceae bacterium]|nr:TetR/AcrR family transcriptional regulator [Polyangiaceae bacterium]